MSRLVLTLLAFVLTISVALSAHAANDPDVAHVVSDAAKGSPSLSGVDADSGELTADQRYRWLHEQHRQTHLLILVGAMTIALIIVLYFLRANPRNTAETLLNGAGLVLVIFGTLYISECAITTEQLTAPMGILGAIAGYIFGSSQRKRADANKPPDAAHRG